MISREGYIYAEIITLLIRFEVKPNICRGLDSSPPSAVKKLAMSVVITINITHHIRTAKD
jgi:hypothetical protein